MMPVAPRIRPSGLFTLDDWATFQIRPPRTGPGLVMHIPCWKLPAQHRAVRSRLRGERMDVAGSYLRVLGKASAKT